MVQAADFAKTLQLTVLSPSTQTEWDIRTTDLNRPGMQFCGFYEYFPFERPPVLRERKPRRPATAYPSSSAPTRPYRRSWAPLRAIPRP